MLRQCVRRISRRDAMQTVLGVMGGALIAFRPRPGHSTLTTLAMAVSPAAPAATLDRLAVHNRTIRDTSGRQIVLRGLVTITSDHEGKAVDLTQRDYERMRQWGFNCQAIRLQACRLGADPSCQLDRGYLDLLDRWTSYAEREGIYTVFKMTTYDVPSWGARRAFDPQRWQTFFENENQQQDAFIRGWRSVWDRMAGRPCVLGYDVLNEPHAGGAGGRRRPLGRLMGRRRRPPAAGGASPMEALAGFYDKIGAELRRVDRQAVMLFQPLVGEASSEPIESPDVPNTLFAPHLYPRSIREAPGRTDQILRQADGANAAILFGEYGYPDRNFLFVPAWTPESGRVFAKLLDQHGLSAIRPWYTHSPLWSVLDARGNEQTEKMDILSRPYPQRTAGTHRGWTYEFDRHVFEMQIEPTPGINAPTEIFVPARRHYESGFTVELDGERSVFDVGDGQWRRKSSRHRISFDAKREVLVVEPMSARARVRISPA